MLDRWQLADLVDVEFFDEIANTAALLCEASTGLISLVTRFEQCNIGKFGFEHRSIDLDQSFCSQVVVNKRMMIVEDATEHPELVNNALVTGPPYIRFYVGIPLLVDNRVAVGALCVFDHKPRRLSIQERAGLMALVHHVEQKLHAAVGGIEGVTIAANEALAELARQAAPEVVGSQVKFDGLLVELARQYEKRLSHKTFLSTMLLTKMRLHLGFLRADTEWLGKNRSDVSQSVRLHDEIHWTLDMVDQLAEANQAILGDPEGKLRSSTAVSFGGVVQKARSSILQQLRLRTGSFVVTQKAVEDHVFGDPTLLEDFATRIFAMTLRTVEPDSDIEVVIENRGSDLIMEVYSDGEVPPEPVRKRLFEMHTDSEVVLTDLAHEWERSLQLCAMIIESHEGSIDFRDAGANRRCLHVTLPTAVQDASGQFMAPDTIGG